MFNLDFAASPQGRDAAILSNITEAIRVDRASGPRDVQSAPEDDLEALRRRIVELQAENARQAHRLGKVREIMHRQPRASGSDEESVVAFHPRSMPGTERRGPNAAPPRSELRSCERRRRDAKLETRMRIGCHVALDLGALPKILRQEDSQRSSATIIPFPVARTKAAVDAVENGSSEIVTGFVTNTFQAHVEIIDDASTERPVVEQIDLEVELTDDARRPAADRELAEAVLLGEDQFPSGGDRCGLAEVNAALSPSPESAPSWAVSKSSQQIKEADKPAQLHRDWSLTQRRHFTAFAAAGHSAQAIAGLMARGCGMSVSVESVRLALNERAITLNKSYPRQGGFHAE